MKKLTKQHYLGSLFNVRISGNLSLVLGTPLFTYAYFQDPLSALIGSIFAVFIVFLHEWGHAMVAKKLGCKQIEIEMGLFNSHMKAYSTPASFELISFGGVLAQLLLLIVYFVTTRALQISIPLGDSMFMWFNVVLLITNALPIKPLDGHQMFQFISRKVGQYRDQYSKH